MASKSRSQADAQFIDTLKMIYDHNYIKLHHWRKDIDYPHSKVKMILMKNIHKSNMPYKYNRYPERYIIANLDYSVYYNDIIWYKSADDAIYIQKIFEDDKDTKNNYVELIKLNPKDLSIIFKVKSNLRDYLEGDGCSYVINGDIHYITTLSSIDDTKSYFNFYTIQGKLFKAIEVKDTLLGFSTTKESDGRLGVGDILRKIRKISDNKLLIHDEIFKFDVRTGEILNSEPWGIGMLCKTYEISVDKESIDKFNEGKSSELIMSFVNHSYMSVNKDKYKILSIIFNRYTGNFFLYRDDNTYYKISYTNMHYITGKRIIEIMKFIGSETALKLADVLANLRVSEDELSSFIDVLKIGDTPENNLYSDVSILNIGHTNTYRGYGASYRGNDVYNELLASVRYFIDNRKTDNTVYTSNLSYKAEVVNVSDFANDIAEGMKTYEIRLKSDKLLKDLSKV